MRKNLLGVLSVVLGFILYPESGLFACGYDFVGDCASNIKLSVNNTPDSFSVSACPSGPRFDGTDLGRIRSLRLVGARAITWESCTNNVTGMTLYYRLVPVGQVAPAWSKLNLKEDYNTLIGPYTTRYRSVQTDLALSNGLSIGKDYVLEMYYIAEIDTLGDDFKPETTLVLNNHGANYKLKFQYSGPEGPPFTVVATRAENARCYGDSSGVVGVSVYGDQTGLFYKWSGPQSNFYTLYQVPAGTYTVTVTGVNGATQSTSVSIGQAPPLSAKLLGTEPAGCNGMPGQASVSGQGGTQPYTYLWSSGTPEATGVVPKGGLWTVTVTDAHNCKSTLQVNVPTEAISVTREYKTEICYGESFKIGAFSANKTGQYSFLLNNPGGCDTLVKVDLTVVGSDTLLVLLPDSAAIICLSPTIDLCGRVATGVQYRWERNGVKISEQRCYTATQNGVYTLFTSFKGQTKTCTFSKKSNIRAYFTPPTIAISGAVRSNCIFLDSVPLALKATSNAVNPQYEWHYGGKTISKKDTCLLMASGKQGAPFKLDGFSVDVVDQYGCRKESAEFAVALPPAVKVSGTVVHASGLNKSDGRIQLSVTGASGVLKYKWTNGAESADLNNLKPGSYCVTVSDVWGCTFPACFQISVGTATLDPAVQPLKIFPNPVIAGQPFYVKRPETLETRPGRLEVFDVSGRLAWSENWESGRASAIWPGSSAPGLYTVRWLCAGAVLLGTVVQQ